MIHFKSIEWKTIYGQKRITYYFYDQAKNTYYVSWISNKNKLFIFIKNDNTFMCDEDIDVDIEELLLAYIPIEFSLKIPINIDIIQGHHRLYRRLKKIDKII